ncbi:hypothetical protein Hypma_004424 [Hypsizygus marmoreus]|uniref:Uncharacterized protein n=1 Tax=Hypsizygus marmoreus TaxID=39966 RepID=A0A369K001_HYPMA|nr:hypothetical protein Hypma_004424 [Hypsizygus marmoreus]
MFPQEVQRLKAKRGHSLSTKIAMISHGLLTLYRLRRSVRPSKRRTKSALAALCRVGALASYVQRPPKRHHVRRSIDAFRARQPFCHHMSPLRIDSSVSGSLPAFFKARAEQSMNRILQHRSSRRDFAIVKNRINQLYEELCLIKASAKVLHCEMFQYHLHHVAEALPGRERRETEMLFRNRFSDLRQSKKYFDQTGSKSELQDLCRAVHFSNNLVNELFVRVFAELGRARTILKLL